MTVLAKMIERDMLARIKRQPEAFDCRCFHCRKPYNKGDGRFCSAACRLDYDALAYQRADDVERVSNAPLDSWRAVAGPPGVQSYNPLANSTQLSRGIKRRGPNGFVIECFGCGKNFDSRGLRCCSSECERQYLKHCENEQLMAEVGMERPNKRKCEECGDDIPNWRNGRRVSSKTRFCSSRCKAKNRRMARGSQNAVLYPETAKIPA